uniref:Adenine phosphoribosyltransferase n=1 Tax=Strigamia maritima TaxID=126957 RepID=T1IYG3_STRMM
MVSDAESLEVIRNRIKDYPDFPKPGVLFRDIFTLFHEPKLVNSIVSMMADHISKTHGQVDIIAGIESRGFLFAVPLSLQLSLPFVPIRKKGKLPGETENIDFQLEYGTDTLEIQKNSIKNGQKVVIIDDLLATGGTLDGSCKLVEKVGGIVSTCLIVMELLALKGRAKINTPLHSLLKYP